MTRITILLLIALTAILACEDDPASTTCIDCGGSLYQQLSQRMAVLNNLELAYNKRNANHYDELLDNNFTFFYTDGDVGGGGGPVQWGRADEMTVTNGLFGAASAITLDVKFEDGVSWVESVPASAPAEEWYTTTVDYNFNIQLGDTHYYPDLGAKATFTVRNAGTNDAPHWRLVEMRDLGGPAGLLAFHLATSTEQKTWGAVKAMYRK